MPRLYTRLLCETRDTYGFIYLFKLARYRSRWLHRRAFTAASWRVAIRNLMARKIVPNFSPCGSSAFAMISVQWRGTLSSVLEHERPS